MTGITWSASDVAAGGQGAGIVSVGFQSAPAIVVVFHDVAGIFQDVSVTPSNDRVLDASDCCSTTQGQPLDPSPQRRRRPLEGFHRPRRQRQVSDGAGIQRVAPEFPSPLVPGEATEISKTPDRPPREVRGSPTLTIA